MARKGRQACKVPPFLDLRSISGCINQTLGFLDPKVSQYMVKGIYLRRLPPLT